MTSVATTCLSEPHSASTIADRGQRTSEQGDALARRRYQRGTVQRRGQNWIGRWREDYIEEDGSTRRKRRSQVIGTMEEFPTKKLARRQLDIILARINALDYRPGRVASLEQFAARWQSQVGSLRKPSTAKSQASHLRYHIIPMLGNNRLDELNLEAQQSFVARLSKSLKRKTLLNVLQTLSVVLNTAKSWGYVTEGMSIKRLTLPPRGAHVSARFFSADEARRIISAAPEPYATIYAVAAMTGMRAGELLGLKISDLDFAKNLIFVQRSLWNGQLQAPKSQTSVRHRSTRASSHNENFNRCSKSSASKEPAFTRFVTPVHRYSFRRAFLRGSRSNSSVIRTRELR
jgi:integrase